MEALQEIQGAGEVRVNINDLIDQNVREVEEGFNSDESKSSSSEGDEEIQDGDSGEEAEGMEEEFKWDEKDNFFFGVWPGGWLKPFTEPNGARNLPAQEDFNPLETFSLLFSDDIIGLLVQNTNRYAQVYIDSFENQDLLPKYLKEWRFVTHEDMMKTITIFIYMGMVRLPTIEDCWKTDPFPPLILCRSFSAFEGFSS